MLVHARNSGPFAAEWALGTLTAFVLCRYAAGEPQAQAWAQYPSDLRGVERLAVGADVDTAETAILRINSGHILCKL